MLRVVIEFIALIAYAVYKAAIYAISLLVVIILAIVDRIQKKKVEEIKFSFEDIDRMDGYGFEFFVADVLKKNGFRNVSVTKASGDYGVDIVAVKEKQKYAFQCKRYQNTLGLKPIQEVYAGAKKYGASRAVVVTNSYFSKNAKTFARELDVDLWDRDTLEEIMWKNKQQNRQEQSRTEVLDITGVLTVENRDKSQQIIKKMEGFDMAAQIGAGKYIFGEDLPLGKYDLKVISGRGALNIQKSAKKYEGEYEEIYIYLSEDSKSGATSYRGLSMPQGWYFTIEGNAIIEISRSKMIEVD